MRSVSLSDYHCALASEPSSGHPSSLPLTQAYACSGPLQVSLSLLPRYHMVPSLTSFPVTLVQTATSSSPSTFPPFRTSIAVITTRQTI